MVEFKFTESVRDEITGKDINFEYQDSFDPEVEREKLGLDGVSAIKLSSREKGRIATRLYRNGFLTEEEIESLGGKVFKPE